MNKIGFDNDMYVRLQSERIRDAFDAAQGEGHVDMRLFHNEKHADDNLYSDDNLASVVEYLQKD